MPDKQTAAADSTAVRVALWRAMHVQVDPPPHVFEDEIGLRLAAPDEGWRRRPDMDPHGTSQFRASIVARARFIEDLVVEQAARGVDQSPARELRGAFGGIDVARAAIAPVGRATNILRMTLRALVRRAFRVFLVAVAAAFGAPTPKLLRHEDAVVQVADEDGAQE
jgi:hypothetical protein